MPGLIRRASAILVAPKAEWARIEAENAPIRDVHKSYVLILAAIGPAATFIAAQVAAGGDRPSLASAAAWALLGYVFALAAVHLLALAANALAPRFGGIRDGAAAFRLAAYSSTAAWLARILLIVPSPWAAVGGLLVSLYSFYLLHLGVPRMMHVPEAKAGAFTATLVVMMLAVNLAAFLILRAF
jgi:hypothetical protein